MSIIIPAPGQSRAEPTPVGRLATTLLSVTVAGMADPARFRRGKAYVADRAVTRLEVDGGLLTASVLGSRSDAYRVVISVRTIERPTDLDSAQPQRTHITRLVPEGADIMVSCTCPDFDEPCKHAVATLLAFANELGARPELLVEWRCGTSDASLPQRATAGSRARADRHLRLVQPPVASPFDNDEWREFEGVHLSPPQWPALPDQPASVGAAALDAVDVGDVVRSALAELRR